MNDMDLRRNLHTGHLDSLLRMRSAIAAESLGLDPKEFLKPFPGNNLAIHNHFGADPAPMPAPVPVRKGLSKLAGLGMALAGAAFPLVGIAGYLLAGAKPAVSILQPVEKTVEKIVKQPGKSYGVDVDVELIPPPEGE